MNLNTKVSILSSFSVRNSKSGNAMQPLYILPIKDLLNCFILFPITAAGVLPFINSADYIFLLVL